MIVSEIEDTVIGPGVRRLSASVTSGANPSVTHRIWLQRPGPDDGHPGLADPVFAAFLIPSMALGEDLIIEGPVSPDLIKVVRENLIPVLLRWHPGLSEVSIQSEVPTHLDHPTSHDRRGCLFSGGVDSWHALTREQNSISSLIHIHGFEIMPEDVDTWKRAHKEVVRVAADFDLEVLPVATNFLQVALHRTCEQLAEQKRSWPGSLGNDAWFGSMLVSVGLSLRPALGHLTIPASWTERIDYPIASHPLMEPSWSTNSMRFELSGFDTPRLDKIRFLASSTPEVLTRLRVCIDDGKRLGNQLNCGLCVKCVRTMMELRICGISEYQAGFEHSLDLKRAMKQRFPGDASHWRDLAVAADAAGDSEIRDAIHVILDEKLYLPRVLSHIKRAVANRSLQPKIRY